jgi:CBS domain-containing protein
VYRYVAGKVDWLANGLPSEGTAAHEPRIGALIIKNIPTCGLDERSGDIRRKLEHSPWDLCAVINAQGIILGDLRGKALADSPTDCPVGQVMNPGPSSYRPNVSVREMREHLTRTGARRVWVADSDGRLLGLLCKESLWQSA